MTQTMIEANEIRMALGEGAGRVEALKGINLTLAGGELTLLMGPSGSGKTTLLSVLGCMLSPTSGSVNIRGRAITGLDAEELAQVRRENIGFVFQSYHLFPTLTAANIGDVSALRERAEVNEQDLGRIRLRQAVLARAGAFRGREFKGRVSSIARVVGLSRINSGDPRKFSDVDVLKVLVELPNPGLLVVGEQVDVYFKSDRSDQVETQ